MGRWKLGTYAHEKLGVCNRGFCETSGVFVETSGVLFRCMGVVCALVALSVYSSLSFFSAFVHLGNFCRGEGTQSGAFFRVCLHIPLECGSVRGLTMQGGRGVFRRRG